MKPLDGLSDYLRTIERRLRLLAVTRGVAVSAAAALAFTVLAVLLANYFAFSNPSVLTARVLLFLGLASAIAGALIIPLLRLNRRRAARTAETRYPQFEERLLTFTERMDQNARDPFLPLLAADTMEVARQAEPRDVAKTAWMFSFSSAAVVSALVLLWLGTSGPGFLGYGTSLLWGGLPKGELTPYYAIQVQPGNKTIRKRADQTFTATLMGFTAPKVRFFAKYASASQWQQAEMVTQPGGSGYQFLMPGVPESLAYYVEAGGVRSDTFKLNVIDLPSVKRVRVTYHFPAWTGMKDVVEDPGGDLRAVEGTTAEVAVITDRPLSNGTLMLDDGSKLNLRSGPNNTLVASVPIARDGMYHVAAVEGGEDVRLSEDYFIEAQKDHPPEVSITRPGRDFRASPIEEVTVAVNAKDDFGLRNLELHYSVNGAAEKVVSLLQAPGAKASTGSAVISLEDFKVQPGDIVSLYASAKGARQTTNTDMFFIEAQPFEKNYSQSQQAGGGGGGGDEQDPADQIPERQKEIITATWNQIKGGGPKGTSDTENAAFLSSVQSKLGEQAKSLADRMKARQINAAGDSFKSFVDDMEKAVAEMGPASQKLKGQSWKDALAPEQRSLQYLLRAAATFRDIQVAFGQQGGGGGGGGQGATRDMEGLFDLELDTEKNQYEGQRQQAQGQSDEARQKQIDEALQKLQQLARRQQELADQARRSPQTPEQRYQQEMLRREAEKLQQQMQQMQQNAQLSRNGQQSQQQGQQGQQGQQSGQQGQSGQSGQQGQSGQMGQMGQQGQQSPQQQMQQQMQQQRNQDPRLRNADARQLQQTIDKLTQALQDMRQAASSQQAGSPQGDAEARRAADRLQEALQGMQSLRGAQSGNQVQELAQQADDLAKKQQDFEGQMRRAYGPSNRGMLPRDQAEGLAGQKDAELSQLKKLEQDMQNAVRDLMATQRPAANRMRDALGQLQQQDVDRDMQRNSDWIRHGMGAYAAISEAQTTAALNQLRDQMQNVQQALGKDGAAGGKDGKDAAGDQATAEALSHVEQLRRQMEQLQAQLQAAQRGRQGQGQQLSRNGQPGGQQQGGQQQGGQQAGGQQQGGQRAGGQQQGGQQQGGQQAGGTQPGGQQYGNGNNGGNNGGNYIGGRYGDWYGGNWNPNGTYIRPEDMQRTYQDAMQSLNQLQQQFRDDPGTQRDIQNAVRDLRQWDPFTHSNDALLGERIGAALAGVEQVELELRRKVDDTTGGGNVRTAGSEPVPQGFEDAVYEYRRKLSQTKQ